MAPTNDFRTLDALKRLLRPENPGYVSGLTATERLVMVALVDRANGAGECFPSLTKLADGTGLARSTVASALKALSGRRPPLLLRHPRPRPASTLYRLLLDSPGDGLVREPDYREADDIVREPDQIVREPDQGSPTVGPEGGKGGAHEGTHEGGRSKNWPARAAELWREKVGAMTPGRIGKALSSLVAEHGEAEVEEVLRRYLAEERAKFVSLNAFVEKYLKWRNEKPGSGRRGPVQYDPNDSWPGGDQ
jgi:hypothetical protein